MAVIFLVALMAGACTTRGNVAAPSTISTSGSAITTTTTSSIITTTVSTTTTVQPVPLTTLPSHPLPTEIFYNGNYPEACTAGQELAEQIYVYVFPDPNRAGAPLNPPITGTVTFSGPLNGTASVDVLNGRASMGGNCPVNDVGRETETFSYSGDANWAPSNSSGPYEILEPPSS